MLSAMAQQTWHYPMKSVVRSVRRTVRAGEIPSSWHIDLADGPDAMVEVVVTQLPRPQRSSPRRFVGMGRGVYADAAEIDSHVSAERDSWEA